jgi:plasmid stability protein
VSEEEPEEEHLPLGIPRQGAPARMFQTENDITNASIGRLEWMKRVRPDVDMLITCAHASHMSKMVQVRNVPDTLHRKLKARAADVGQTLSDYLMAELERLAARPTRDEMLTRLHGRKRITLKTPAAVVIRQEREPA